MVAEKEFHRSRWWWAYKWLKRFDKLGLDGLKDKHRSGRPSEVSEETFAEIRRELSENSSVWKAKEIMILSTKEQVSGIRKFMSIDCYINGDLNQRFLERRGLSILHQKKRERTVQKNVEEIISNIPDGFTVVVEDESIFVHDIYVG